MFQKALYHIVTAVPPNLHIWLQALQWHLHVRLNVLQISITLWRMFDMFHHLSCIINCVLCSWSKKETLVNNQLKRVCSGVKAWDLMSLAFLYSTVSQKDKDGWKEVPRGCCIAVVFALVIRETSPYSDWHFSLKGVLLYWTCWK